MTDPDWPDIEPRGTRRAISRVNAMIRRVAAAGAVAALVGGALAGTAAAQDPVTLTLQTWRVEDKALWEEKIFPAFTATHPNINLVYDPSPTTEYDAAVDTRMQGGTAGDLIMCRPYDVTWTNIDRGYFAPINGTVPLDNFDELTLSAWTRTPGQDYCVPFASVMSGLFYNKDIFAELGLEVPTTMAEFMAVLEAIKTNGKYIPLAYGSADGWILRINGFDNIGPNYWHGEEGRQGLLDKSKSLTDPEFVAALTALQSWAPYMPPGQAAVTYPDASQLFALGQAAIFPTGSWDITAVTSEGANVGVLAPPVPNEGDDLYVQVQPDIAMAANAKSPNLEAAMEFLKWVATPEFEQLYSEALPGFFPLGKAPIELTNPIAQEFLAVQASAAGVTPRLTQDRLSAGNPPLTQQQDQTLPLLMDGSMTPEALAADWQKVLENGYWATLP